MLDSRHIIVSILHCIICTTCTSILYMCISQYTHQCYCTVLFGTQQTVQNVLYYLYYMYMYKYINLVYLSILISAIVLYCLALNKQCKMYCIICTTCTLILYISVYSSVLLCCIVRHSPNSAKCIVLFVLHTCTSTCTSTKPFSVCSFCPFLVPQYNTMYTCTYQPCMFTCICTM